MRKTALIPILISGLCAAAAASASASSTPAPALEFDRYEDGALHFKSASETPETTGALKRLPVALQDPRHLGTLQSSDGGIPYFLFAENNSIVLVQPSKETKPAPVMSFVYPGRILDAKDRSLLLESRAFYGKCLSGRPGDVYVVFQKERVDRRRGLQSSVFIAQPGKDRVQEQLLEKRLPSINDTLKRVKRKECREVDGRYRTLVRKPLDLRYRSKMKDEDDEDEDDTPGAGESSPSGPSGPSETSSGA